RLVERLAALHHRVSAPNWPWFEDRLTYANAQLPHALIASAARMKRDDLVAAKLRALEWLVDLQMADGRFAPIGTNGFAVRGAAPARFDQQPIEAATTIAACLDAAHVTADTAWLDRAGLAFDWLLGRNHLQQPLYDAATGGCRDGLHRDRVNENEGAESTLAFLLALTDMRTIHPSVISRPLEATSP